MTVIPRAARRLAATLLLTSPTIVAPLSGGIAQVVAPPTAAPASPSWLHAGSDIPADPAWEVGVLPNGVRYAVRRNATPPGTVAIRVRIDAGALMEGDAQSGWAHLLEHMVFRGTATRPDGEAVKLWQRLGAQFGSDTNATTSLRATTYKLDVPRTDAKSLDDAVGALADMMQTATVAPGLLDIERKVVLAERAARITPLARKIQAASRGVLQSGLLAAERDVGGTEASLAAADAAKLRAFYKRWYRPERAVVFIAGDADPAVLEALVKRHFGDWRGEGKAPPEPAYGNPTEPASRVALVSDPLASPGMLVSWITPHVPGPMTAERQRGDYVDQIALRVLNQRLAQVALTGGPLLGASANMSRSRNLADTVGLSVSPRDGAWAGALEAAFGVLNRVLASPVEQGEIDQQTASLGAALTRAVGNSATYASSAWADSVIADVDQGDVPATREFYDTTFAAQKAAITPTVIQARLRMLFAPQPRLLMLSAVPIPGGEAAVVAAFAKARSVESGAAAAIRTITLDQLSPPLTPGKVVREHLLAEFGIDRVTFANGVELVMKKTAFARDTINVDVRIGRGRAARSVNDRSPEWSSGVLPSSGIGDATPPEIARLTAGRQVGFGLGVATDATVLASVTNPRDLADALRVMVAEVRAPRVDPVALGRYRSGYVASLKSLQAQPQSVFQALGTTALYGGDRRFQPIPTPAEVSGTDVAAIRAFWTQTLGEGPVTVSVVGDFDRAATITAVAASFGGLPARTPVPVDPARAIIPPLRTPAPLVLRHRGDPTQALAAVAWRTTGGLTDLKQTRALTVAIAILQDRLNVDFRETQGGTYTPFVTSIEARGFDDFGVVLAGAQLTPDRIGDFRATVQRIVTDLATNGPSADSLDRAKETAVGGAQRAIAGNAYWSALLSRDLDDPRQLESIRTYVSGRRAVDAAAVRDVVRRYLVDGKPLLIEVLPQPAAPAPGTPAIKPNVTPPG